MLELGIYSKTLLIYSSDEHSCKILYDCHIFQDMVDELDGVSAKQLLKQVIERNPSLILDVAAKLSPEEPIPCPHPEVPSWCVCQHCRDMPTDLEKLCCGMRPDLCSSTQPVSF